MYVAQQNAYVLGVLVRVVGVVLHSCRALVATDYYFGAVLWGFLLCFCSVFSLSFSGPSFRVSLW